MSLNKTLDRLFDEIRREAKRNPAFADRMDAVLRLHESRREVTAAVIGDVAGEHAPALKPKKAETPDAARPPALAAKPAPAINPAGMLKREGEEALWQALADQDMAALRALVVEHNLDPGGVTATLTRDELADHVVAQARKRAERDEKMFDY